MVGDFLSLEELPSGDHLGPVVLNFVSVWGGVVFSFSGLVLDDIFFFAFGPEGVGFVVVPVVVGDLVALDAPLFFFF